MGLCEREGPPSGFIYYVTFADFGLLGSTVRASWRRLCGRSESHSVLDQHDSLLATHCASSLLRQTKETERAFIIHFHMLSLYTLNYTCCSHGPHCMAQWCRRWLWAAFVFKPTYFPTPWGVLTLCTVGWTSRYVTKYIHTYLGSHVFPDARFAPRNGAFAPANTIPQIPIPSNNPSHIRGTKHNALSHTVNPEGGPSTAPTPLVRVSPPIQATIRPAPAKTTKTTTTVTPRTSRQVFFSPFLHIP